MRRGPIFGRLPLGFGGPRRSGAPASPLSPGGGLRPGWFSARWRCFCAPMQSGDRVLVTGGSGFVGSAVLRALGGRSLKLRALVRAASPRANLTDVDCEIVEGDITDEAAMNRALADVRYLFHVAADYRLWARDPGEIVRANPGGTGAVMEAGPARGRRADRLHQQRRHPARRRRGGLRRRDRAAGPRGKAIGAYKRSKVAAERLVERMVAERGPAGGDRQSLDPDRPARHQAHADRPDHRRGGQRAACPPSSTPGSTSCMSTTSPRAMSWRWKRARSASAISWAARTLPCANCWRPSPR